MDSIPGASEKGQKINTRRGGGVATPPKLSHSPSETPLHESRLRLLRCSFVLHFDVFIDSIPLERTRTGSLFLSLRSVSKAATSRPQFCVIDDVSLFDRNGLQSRDLMSLGDLFGFVGLYTGMISIVSPRNFYMIFFRVFFSSIFLLVSFSSIFFEFLTLLKIKFIKQNSSSESFWQVYWVLPSFTGCYGSMEYNTGNRKHTFSIFSK